MKILIIHNRYQSNNIGGEDIVYENELLFLQKKLGCENVYSYEVSNDDINKFKLLFEIWFSNEHYKKVRAIVKENRIDLVHVHNFFPLLTPSVFKAAKDEGAKVVHTLHNYRLWCISGIFFRDGYGICEKCSGGEFSLFGVLNKCYRKSMLQSIVAQMAFWFYKTTKIFDNIDYFFVLTKFQKAKVKSLGIHEQKIILKPNSFDMPFDIQKEKNGYIYVGRLEEAKGVYELLKVWKSLDERFVLTVIGSGEIDEDLQKEFNQKNIIFKGKCSRDMTLSYISKSKYLIQPSIWYETFGLTIIEAMSFGVPVIGFDVGTRGDFIKEGENGFLCAVDDLEEVIKKSYDFAKYEELSKNAIKTAKLYENDCVIASQIEIYKNILGHKT